MNELALELKKDYGKEGQKTFRRTFSGLKSVFLPSGNFFQEVNF